MCPACLTTLAVTIASTTGVSAALGAFVLDVVKTSKRRTPTSALGTMPVTELEERIELCLGDER